MKIHFPAQIVLSLIPILPFSGYLEGLTLLDSVSTVTPAQAVEFVTQFPHVAPPNLAQVQQTQAAQLCPEPALSRLTRHTIAAGETVESIAQQYNLIPATLLGFNPALRSGNTPVGTQLRIPPYNGIQVEVPAEATWQTLAGVYNVRADALFEVNGCQAEVPQMVFVPGVNWTPTQTPPTNNNLLRGYPLPDAADVLVSYGWQVDPATSQVIFQSGVHLQAETGTPVLAVGDGTIAFAGIQEGYGNLVVINHNQGLQTRYAQMGSITVQSGQQVQVGETLGTVGAATIPYLQFEVRSNSSLGWVAQDPGDYIPAIRSADSIRRQRERAAE